MIKITYLCDRCGCQISSGPVRISMRLLDPESSGEGECVFPDIESMDFCESCSGQLAGVIRKKIRGLVPREPPEDPPPEKRKRAIDTGKVGALRNAGWSVKAIAEEMSCSEAAIYNTLKKLGMSVGGKAQVKIQEQNQEAERQESSEEEENNG